MLYKSAQDFLASENKSIALFGMSGVGKTTISALLSQQSWFHYSVDYRIGTRYLNEEISNALKASAMRDPLLGQLLRQDAIYLGLNITVDNLAPLSSYVGMLGDSALGGLDYGQFMHRQALHRKAEIAALLDSAAFKQSAQQIYGYPHFICDTGGSLIEVIELDDRNDPVTLCLTQHCLPVYIEADAGLLEQIISRGLKEPKPMYYNPNFIENAVKKYLEQHGLKRIEQAAPRDFAAWVLAELLHDRAPRYRRFAQQHGCIISAKKAAELKSEQDLLAAIAQAIDEAAAR